MQSKASAPKEYLDSLPEDKKHAVGELKEISKKSSKRLFGRNELRNAGLCSSAFFIP